MSSLIYASGQVLENIRKSNNELATLNPVAYAFGLAWGRLTEKQRKEILEYTEKMAQESESN